MVSRLDAFSGYPSRTVGETPHEAIRREIAEEVNYTLSTDDGLQFVDELRITYGDVQATVYCFTAQLPGLDKFSDSDEVFVRDPQ